MTLNNVRALLDARTVITDKSTGKVYDYVLTASCKTEQARCAAMFGTSPTPTCA